MSDMIDHDAARLAEIRASLASYLGDGLPRTEPTAYFLLRLLDAAARPACLLIVKPGDPAMMIKALVAQECMRAINARASSSATQPEPTKEDGNE